MRAWSGCRCSFKPTGSRSYFEKVIAVNGKLNRRMLDPRRIRFVRTPDQRLYLETESGREGPVKVQSPFPLTDPTGYVVVSDTSGGFIGLIKDFHKLDPDSLALVQEGLEESYFLPKITKIDQIEDQFRVMIWHVQTDRGPRRFEVTSRRRDIRWLSDQHVVIQDADGNRYEITDLSQLDKHSRDLLEMEV